MKDPTGEPVTDWIMRHGGGYRPKTWTGVGYRPKTWTGVCLEVQDARTAIASIAFSPAWKLLDRGQQRAVGHLLAELRTLARALGDA